MSLAGVIDAVKSAAARRQPLVVRGGGSKAFYGLPIEGKVLDTRGLSGIVDYEPTELVITARGGTPLGVVEATLAGEGQMLAFEPPHFGPGATIGGAVAAGLAGPRRAAQNGYCGAVRDFVLGAKLVDGNGQSLSFGGRVMKNVAGYDVSRLLAGSLGTLGVIAEVSLKVLPRPVATRTLRMVENDAATVIEKLNRWGGQPLPVTASVWCDGHLHLRLEGADAAVASAARNLGGEAIDAAAAEALWRGVREQTAPFFASAQVLWRLSVPSTAVPLDLPGQWCIEWGGALRWLVTAAAPADVRRAALRAGGHATLFRAPDAFRREHGVFAPLDPGLSRIHTRLKAAFDPQGILNRARMYPDF
jgi:glycolate oxidase FAD binding subunit